MINLRKTAGFDLLLNDDMSLKFAPIVGEMVPAVRRHADCLPVLQDAQADAPEELYWMYRDLALPWHRRKLLELNLRYDITVIRPGLVGQEYIKTVGHYHPVIPGQTLTWPEVYEVLHGEATYLLQKPGKEAGTLEDVLILRVQAGEKAIIPPGYGHITINAGPEVLVMANWVSTRFQSVYGEIAQLHGGGYYFIERAGRPLWVENPNYLQLPDLRMVQPKDVPEWGYVAGRPMYRLIEEAPEQLLLLNEPQRFFEEASHVGE